MRNFAPDDAEVSARFAASVRGAFEEDRMILNAVQKGMDALHTPNLDLVIDLGRLRFRSRLRKMIEAGEAIEAAAAG